MAKRPTTLASAKDKALVKAALDSTSSGGVWKPQAVGDAVAGEVLSMKEQDGKYGPQTVLIIDTPDGPRTVFANESLKRGLEENGVKSGKRVAVVYKGTMTTGRGRPFKLFSVASK